MYPEDPRRRVEEKLFLAIEYTRSSITAAILDQECDDYEMLSRLWSKRFGYDAMQACKSAADSDETCNAALEAALRKMVRESSTTTKQQGLGAVFVFVEKTADENFAAVLHQVLDDNFSNGASVIPVRVEHFSPDLAFAGSRVMAMLELSQKAFQRELSTGGKSKHDEL